MSEKAGDCYGSSSLFAVSFAAKAARLLSVTVNNINVEVILFVISTDSAIARSINKNGEVTRRWTSMRTEFRN